MSEQEDEKPTFIDVTGKSVLLDGAIFRRMRFIECNMVYRGGTVPLLADNQFSNCRFSFENEARNTVDFLHALGTGDGNAGGRALVLSLLGLSDGREL